MLGAKTFDRKTGVLRTEERKTAEVQKVSRIEDMLPTLNERRASGVILERKGPPRRLDFKTFSEVISSVAHSDFYTTQKIETTDSETLLVALSEAKNRTLEKLQRMSGFASHKISRGDMRKCAAVLDYIINDLVSTLKHFPGYTVKVGTFDLRVKESTGKKNLDWHRDIGKTAPEIRFCSTYVGPTTRYTNDTEEYTTSAGEPSVIPVSNAGLTIHRDAVHARPLLKSGEQRVAMVLTLYPVEKD